MSNFSEEFCCFVSKEPCEPWGYDVDDHGITYGAGWWPWYRFHQWQRGVGGGPVIEASVRPTSLRIAPDDTYEAGNQRYVLARPSDDHCNLDMSWMTRTQGLGGMVVRGFVRLDRTLRIVSEVPEEVRNIVESRVEKFRRRLARACAERDAGQKEPVTMHDKWAAKQAKEPLHA